MPSRIDRCDQWRASPQRPLRASAHASTSSPATEGRANVGEAGELERLGEADAAVCAIERGLQVDPGAVRRLDLLDRGNEAVLLACLARPAGGREQVAELGDVAGERDRLDRAPLELDRTAEPPPRRLESRQRVESGCIAGTCGEREPVEGCGASCAADRPVQLSELDRRPGVGLGTAGRGVQGELHGVDRGRDVAAELPRVGDACIRRGVGLQRGHPVESCERGVVAAELEQCIAEDAVRRGRARCRGNRAAGERKRVAEAVAGERDAAEPGECLEVLRLELHGPAERAVGAGDVRRVAGLARPLRVGEPEQRK